MFEIGLQKVKVFAYHGVNEEEKINGQNFYIDALLKVDIDGDKLNDNIENTLSYALVNKLIIKIVSETRFELIESLAKKLVDEIFEHFPKVTYVKITVNKPQAPMRGEFENVFVSFEQTI